jgi:hypothetical protein
MIFNDPTSLPDAVKILLQKELMPTSLDTAGIRELDRSLVNQSMFSAQTLNKYLLQLYKDRVAGILNPPSTNTTPLNQGYIREEVKGFLAQIGYQPNPDEAGTLKDLSSDARIDLVIKTNVEMAQGQGLWLQKQQAVILDGWPASELFRAEGRKIPRDWINRWMLAGRNTGDPIGTGWTVTPGGKLIALKNHAIWTFLGSSALFSDGLDRPWPPFAFNSGMWVRDITRAMAESIGLLKRGAAAPAPMTLAAVLKEAT